MLFVIYIEGEDTSRLVQANADSKLVIGPPYPLVAIHSRQYAHGITRTLAVSRF